MSTLRRLIDLIGDYDTMVGIWDKYTLLRRIITASSIGTFLAGWAARMTHWPIPLVVLFGLAAAAVVLHLWNQVIWHRHQRSVIRSTAIRSDDTPSGPAPVFATESALASSSLRNLSFRIVDLARDDLVITGRTFEDCTIYGPAVVLPMDCIFSHCRFGTAGNTMESMLFEVTANRLFVGPIGLKDCTFIRCDFKRIGVAGQPDTLAGLRSIPAPNT